MGWQWIDPDEDTQPTPHDTKKRVLRIRVPQGKDLTEQVSNAPRYLKSLSGDFQIDTRVKFTPSANYQGAGLLIYSDPRTYVRFEHGYGGPGNGTRGFRVDVRTPQGQRTLITTADAPIDADQVEMRMMRSGSEVMLLFRQDENSEWRQVSKVNLPLGATVMAGIVVCNTAREATVEFEYIHLLPLVQP